MGAPVKSYAIFLRGVMPTGKNRVPMADLRVALADAGLADVKTYIQSGNAVARTGLGAGALESLVHEAIAREIGADIAVIVRTHEQIRQILESNPFPVDAASRTYFTLLAQRPAANLGEELLRLDFSPDRIKIVQDTLYTLYATKLSDSKFNNNFYERKLKLAATTRNYNTMSRMMELCA